MCSRHSGQPARVLHVIGAMNRGGAEAMIMNLYRSIDRSRVQFDFCVHSDREAAFDHEIAQMGGRLFRLPVPCDSPLGWYRSFSKCVRQQGPFSAVHSHVHHFSGVVVWCANQQGVKVRVAHSHNTQDGRGHTRARRVYRTITRRLLYRNATHLLACSHQAGRALYGPAFDHDGRCRVLPNAISLQAFATSATRSDVLEELGLPAATLVVIHVGRCDLQKNHAKLIEVFAAIRQSRQDAVLLLVGDGPFKEATVAKASQCGVLQRTHFLGIRSDVSRLLSAADVMILPSLFEGFPMAAVEAQASGVPCVASSAITSEIAIGAAPVRFCELSSPAAKWATAALEVVTERRKTWPERERLLRDAGYDAASQAAAITELYVA